MKPFDDGTLQALADLICKRRGGLQGDPEDVGAFLRNAGIKLDQDTFLDTSPEAYAALVFGEQLRMCPRHETRGRCLEVLRELNASPTAVKKVLRRLVEPKEYGGNSNRLQVVMDKLNGILAPEGVRVALDGVRPKIEDVGPHVPARRKAEKTTPVPVPSFCPLVQVQKLARILASRWKEVDACLNAGAHLSAIILMGSILEGVLHSMAQQNKPQATTAKKAPKGKAVDDWSLFELIEVGVECGWLRKDKLKLSHSVREYRNYVHPARELSEGDSPNEGTCKMAWPVVQEAINDVAKFKGVIGGHP